MHPADGSRGDGPLRILQLNKDFPYPPTNGAEVRSWKMAEWLAARGDLYLACPYRDGERPPGMTLVPFESRLTRHKALFNDGYFGLFAVSDRHPLSRRLTRSVVRRVRGLDVSFDLVVTESPQLVDAGIEIARQHDAALLVNKHNAYHALLDQWLESTPVPGPVRRRAVANLRRAEQRGVDAADVVVFQSEDDPAGFDVDGVRTAVIPNGTDVDDLTAGGDADRLRRDLGIRPDAPVAAFVGSFDWDANRAAARRIVDELSPALPEVEFLLAGRNPPDASHRPNVHAPGFVDHLPDVFALADVALCPLSFGSGTKLKMLDYLAAGLPIVTTPVGAQGIPVEDDVHALIRDDDAGMVEAIEALLADAERRERLAANARDLGERYDWAELFAAYEDLLPLGDPGETTSDDGDALVTSP